MSENTNNLKYEDSKFSIENAILDKVEGAIDSSTGEKTITLDSNLKLLGSLDISGATYSLCQSPEWIKVLVDSQERIIAGVRTDGSVYINKIEGVTDAIQEIREALGLLGEKDEELEGRVSNIEGSIIPDIHIVLPDIIYTVPGIQVNLWNDNISLSSDKGLMSPINYKVLWICSKGLITERCFRFEPTTDDIGDVQCTCKLYTTNNILIETKEFTIRVLAKNALNTSKRTLLVGDSIGAGTAVQVYNNFNNSSLFTGTIPEMVGTMGDTPNYEAVGGYAWNTWATAGRPAFRIFVSNIGPLGLGATYKDTNNNYFSVREVNLSNGTGNVLLIQSPLGYGTLVMPSGTLTKYSGTGDETINYTDAYQESANPFWNTNTNSLDFANYRTQHLGLSANEKIDAAFFQLGGNRSTVGPVEEEIPYITALYRAFIADNPSGKFVIVNTVIQGNNDLDGAGNNYGASFDYISYQKRAHDLSVIYNSLASSSDYPNMKIVSPRFFLDRYYGFPFYTRQISSRYPTNEQFHGNFLHPTEGGYQQIADALFAGYIGVLTE